MRLVRSPLYSELWLQGDQQLCLSDKSVLVSVTQQWLHRCKGNAASIYIYYGNLGYQNSVTPKMTDGNLAYTVVNLIILTTTCCTPI